MDLREKSHLRDESWGWGASPPNPTPPKSLLRGFYPSCFARRIQTPRQIKAKIPPPRDLCGWISDLGQCFFVNSLFIGMVCGGNPGKLSPWTQTQTSCFRWRCFKNISGGEEAWEIIPREAGKPKPSADLEGGGGWKIAVCVAGIFDILFFLFLLPSFSLLISPFGARQHSWNSWVWLSNGFSWPLGPSAPQRRRWKETGGLHLNFLRLFATMLSSFLGQHGGENPEPLGKRSVGKSSSINA